MGLAIIAVVMTYGTLDLQEMCRSAGRRLVRLSAALGNSAAAGRVPDLLLTAGMAESKRVPFDLPEGESELVAGYFTEYSGGKQAVFMMTDFAEVVLVAVLITTFFFGGWQVPWLYPRRLSLSRRRPSRSAAICVVALLGVVAFWSKSSCFCWFQILIRWTLPRFRYDQLMRLGWKGLVPLGLVNLVVTAFVVVLASGAQVMMPLWILHFPRRARGDLGARRDPAAQPGALRCSRWW